MAAVLLLILAMLGSTSNQEPKKCNCLPENVRSDEVVSYARDPKQNVTVEMKLDELKARCRHGKLVDANNREIRFFRVSCWGHPPSNYLEIKEKEKADFEKLEKNYTVIVFGCNPRMM